MLIENASSQQAEQGLATTNTIKNQMLQGLESSKDYRHAFVEESIQSRLTAQIGTLRKGEGWDLKTFAAKLGKKLAWAYRLEDPNTAPPTIPTLLEVAKTFDIGLDVRFRRFSELVNDVVHLTPESFSVPSFEAELKSGALSRPVRKRSTRRAEARKKVTNSSRLPFGAKAVVRSFPASDTGPNYLRSQNYGTRKAG